MNRPTWTKVTTEAKKFGVAILGITAILATNGLIPHPYDDITMHVLGILTAVGVYKAQNETVED